MTWNARSQSGRRAVQSQFDRLRGLYQDGLQASAPQSAGAAILVKARQRVARRVTALQPGAAWSDTTTTKDGKAARVKALRAAVSVLSGAGVAGPREEERGRTAWRHPPGLRCRWARGAEALRQGDTSHCASAGHHRMVSPPLAQPSRAGSAPRPSAPFNILAPFRPLTNSAPASQPRLPTWPRPHAAHSLRGT